MKKKKGTNVYEKKITLGRDPDGTPIRKSITGRTQTELNQRIEDARQKWMITHDVSNSILFSTFAERWLLNNKAVRSLNTKQMYQNIIYKHLIPEIGDLYFSEITLTDLQRIINNRASHYNTCNKIKLTLKQIYESAMDEGLAKDIKIKALVLPPKTVNEKRPLTKQETAALFTAKFTEEQEMFVKLLYFTGIRREEALALKGSDIGPDSVRIEKALVFDRNDAIMKDTPKTSASRRSVPVPDSFSAIKEYAKDKDILFPMTTDRTKYMSQSSYVKFWRGITKAMAAAAPTAEDLTAHIFRHNYATMLYYSNISLKKAAQLLGHEGTQMIMQIYAHLDDEQEKAAEKLNNIFRNVENLSNMI